MAKKKNKAAAVLGRLGGQARAKKLSPERRSDIARVASAARRGNHARKCVKCGQAFLGWHRAKWCPDCREKIKQGTGA